jgi:hypothetical protein
MKLGELLARSQNQELLEEAATRLQTVIAIKPVRSLQSFNDERENTGCGKTAPNVEAR